MGRVDSALAHAARKPHQVPTPGPTDPPDILSESYHTLCFCLRISPKCLTMLGV